MQRLLERSVLIKKINPCFLTFLINKRVVIKLKKGTREQGPIEEDVDFVFPLLRGA